MNTSLVRFVPSRVSRAVAGALVVVGSALASVAQAAVPVGVEAVFTTTATDFGTIVGYGWTLLLAIMGGLILFKLAKKVFGAAT